MVAALVMIFGTATVGRHRSTAAEQQTQGLWAVTRDADGRMHVVRGMGAAVAAMDNRLGRDTTQVLSTEQDEPVHLLTTNDALRPQQWAFSAVDFESAWKLSTGAGITVAVVDTGVLGTHEDLAGSVVPGIDLASDAAQYDPARNGEVDPAGHGTHVAGIIAAHPNNGFGIAGAAPGVKIMPIRVLDASGSGSSSDVAEGIIWAADHGAGHQPEPRRRSVAGHADRDPVRALEAGRDVRGRGQLVPGRQPAQLSGGVPRRRSRSAPSTRLVSTASFSNTGSYVDLVAPGDLIWSTYGQGHAVRADERHLDGDAVRDRDRRARPRREAEPQRDRPRPALESTATDLGPPGRDNTFGYGLINPRQALLIASPEKIDQGAKGHGYWIVTADGHVARVRRRALLRRPEQACRPLGADRRRRPHTTGRGYWLAGADGAVYSFGDAQFHGG